jgi:proline dehydrogenase
MYVFLGINQSGLLSKYNPNRLGDRCADQGVDLYIDAEHSHIQPAVRLMTLCMMQRYNLPNRRQGIILNTYQCYLKEAVDHLSRDLEIAKRLDFKLGCKMVRGAYLKVEQELCSADTTRSYPLHSSYEATNDNYDE